MKNKNIYGLLVVFVITAVMFSVFASAGVGFRKVIQGYPGQTLNEKLTLQNFDGSDKIYRGAIVEGEEIVALTDGNEYTVPNGVILDAPIRIRIPSNAPIGQVYKVSMVFETEAINPGAVSGGGGSVQFNTGHGISFDVVVIEEPPAPVVETPQKTATSAAGGSVWMWVIAAIVVVMIIWWLMRMKRKKQSA